MSAQTFFTQIPKSIVSYLARFFNRFQHMLGLDPTSKIFRALPLWLLSIAPSVVATMCEFKICWILMLFQPGQINVVFSLGTKILGEVMVYHAKNFVEAVFFMNNPVSILVSILVSIASQNNSGTCSPGHLRKFISQPYSTQAILSLVVPGGGRGL